VGWLRKPFSGFETAGIRVILWATIVAAVLRFVGDVLRALN
jgi:hypothetical protein